MSAQRNAGRAQSAIARLGWLLVSAGLCALAAFWLVDRMRKWESPRWEAARLISLAGEEPGAAHPRWVVAINPTCPHCRGTLERVKFLAERQSPRPSLCALIVDAPRRPDPRTVASLDVPLVWWDSTSLWRDHWGHRVYGETLVFDGNGDYLRSMPPPEPPEVR